MQTKILSGENISKDMRIQMAKEIKCMQKKYKLTPGLAVVLVGNNPASISYIHGKRAACKKIGIHSIEHNFNANQSETEIMAVVEKLNKDPSIHGILVQLPLPSKLNEQTILDNILPTKDIDGLHPINLGKLIQGKEGFLPCTPHGVQQLLVKYGIEIEGKSVVIVGRSTLVGKSLANILLQKIPNGNATVTVCHTSTPNIAHFTRQADILVAAVGRPGTITADMVAEGAVVVDVGVNRIKDSSKKRGYRLVGDVDFESVAQKATAITPVPGGVGPMTITMLLYNTIQSAKKTQGLT